MGGYYANWKQTPIDVTREWTDYMSLGDVDYSAQTPSISNYLNAHGTAVTIDASLKKEIDGALIQPGSYYAYGNAGIIIVIPAQHRMIFAYNH